MGDYKKTTIRKGQYTYEAKTTNKQASVKIQKNTNNLGKAVGAVAAFATVTLAINALSKNNAKK